MGPEGWKIGLRGLPGPSTASPAVWGSILNMAIEEPALSPRELAVPFTNTEEYFVSEASVYHQLKSLDLITDPAFVVIKAADLFEE